MIVVLAILTLLLPVITLPVNIAFFSTKKKNRAWYGFFIALGLATIAYNFTPFSTQSTDILRHFARLPIVEAMSFTDALKSNAFANLPGYFAILKVASFFHNQAMLPFLSTLVGYALCFYVIAKMLDTDTKKENGHKYAFVALFTFLANTSFLGFCSGIRQYLVFSLFIFLFYKEIHAKKHRWIIWSLYVLLVTVHTSAVVLIVFRLLCELFTHAKKIRWLVIGVACWSLFYNSILLFLSRTFASNSFVTNLLELSDYYAEEPSATIWIIFFMRLFWLLYAFYVIYSMLKKKQNSPTMEKYLYIVLCIAEFSLGAITNFDIFSRFSVLTIIFTIPLLPIHLSTEKKSAQTLQTLGLLAFSATALVYYVHSYNTFHFNDVFSWFTTNIFSIW